MNIRKIILENLLQEKFISAGLNKSQEPIREKYKDQIVKVLRDSYVKSGGYGGIASGSERETKLIYNDVNSLIIKAVVRSGTVTAVSLYKDRFGRKMVATGALNTPEGKRDWKMLVTNDHEQKRSWAEVSGAVQHLQTKMGVPKILSSEVEELIGKNITKIDSSDYEYSRKIGDDFHTKIVMGHPKRS